jgi:hypothetical protein
MRFAFVFGWCVLCIAFTEFAQAEKPEIEKLLAGQEPVMLDITDRDPPDDDEWESLNTTERAGFMGGLGDFKSQTVAFMNTRYFTANPLEGSLASYGKMGPDKRYDRFGQIEGVQFAVEQNSWKQRHVMNAAALFKLAGGRFLEFAGLGLEAAVESGRQFEVTFVGTTVPKDEAIRRMNANPEALEYLDTLRQKRSEYDRQSVKLFAGKAPPAPKVVLANVVMLDGEFSRALDASADGKLHSRVLGDSVELKVVQRNGEQVTLLSPVVRCYRTYSIEFKTDAKGRPALVDLTDRDGRTHRVPQVFDLTPDL